MKEIEEHVILVPLDTFERLLKDIYFEFETDYEKYEEYGINDILRILDTENFIDPKKATIVQAKFMYLVRTPKSTIVGIKVLKKEEKISLDQENK